MKKYNDPLDLIKKLQSDIDFYQEKLDRIYINIYGRRGEDACKEILRRFDQNDYKWEGNDKKFEQLYELFLDYYTNELKKVPPQIMKKDLYRELIGLTKKFKYNIKNSEKFED